MEGKLTVYTPTQDVFGQRKNLAKIFHMPMSKVQVLSPAMGGGFGGKIENVSKLNESGDEIFYFYEYTDKETYACVEDSNQFLQKKGRNYEYDPAESDQVEVGFGIGDAMEKKWADWMESLFTVRKTDGEAIVETSEADGSLYLTLEAPLEAFEEDFPEYDTIVGERR